MRRTDLLDTNPWAHRMVIEHFRRLTPEERLRRLMDMIEVGRHLARSEGRVGTEATDDSQSRR